ncbi:sterol desaturase [Chloropicon primus]|nr:sterol desaturase [Chloropicon primus]
MGEAEGRGREEGDTSASSTPSASWRFTIRERRYCVPKDFQHPGGQGWMRQHTGKDISHLFPSGTDGGVDGEGCGKSAVHFHSSAAVRLLERFHRLEKEQSERGDAEGSEVDKKDGAGSKVEVVNGVSIDLCKPLVFQVGKLRENYQKWVHKPELGKPRFFRSEFCEQLSKTNWWVVPLVWIPVSIYLVFLSLWRCEGLVGTGDGLGSVINKRGNLAAILLICFVFGTLFWSLVEYAVHRFMFHVDTSSYWCNTLHFMFHGCHHKFPMDDMRLVMPPAGALPIVLMVYAVEYLFFGAYLAPVVLAGTLTGYMVYDMIHYHCHFSEFTNRIEWLRQIRSSHMDHHYRDFTKGFGISTPTWDFVLSTQRSKASLL